MIHLGMTLYNKDKYVAQAIQSIINQTFKSWRLTIWNNNSTDDALKIAKSFKDPRITVINNENNLGQAKALNIIFSLYSKNCDKYIGWVDADDFIHPYCLELCYKATKEKNSNFVYTRYQDVNSESKLLEIGFRNEEPYTANASLSRFICHHFRLISIKLFEEIGGIDTTYLMAEDYNLTLKLAEKEIPYRVDSFPLYFYRQHPESDGAKKRLLQNQYAAKAVNEAIIRRNLQNKIELYEGPPFLIKFKK